MPSKSHAPDDGLSRADLERLLLTDDLFADTLNVFLALPVFGVRIFYNKQSRSFEEHAPIELSGRLATIYDPSLGYIEAGARISHGDGQPTFVSVLNPATTLDYIERYRLALFYKSELLSQYTLAKELNIAGPETITSRQSLVEFLGSLRGTQGESVYNCWVDMVRARKCVMNLALDRYFLSYVRRVYYAETSPHQLPPTLRAGKNPGAGLEERLLEELKSYWRRRFTMLEKKEFFVTRITGVAPFSRGQIIVPNRWRRYKLPTQQPTRSHEIKLGGSVTQQLVLRAVSLERLSGGFMWEAFSAAQSEGLQRCLCLLYFVQMWLEFSVPAILEKRKPLQLSDYIYFGLIHITGDKWIGCPPEVTDQVYRLLRFKRGNLNTFKPAVDFSLSYVAGPFVRLLTQTVERFDMDVRVDGGEELREALVEQALHEPLFVTVRKRFRQEGCRSAEVEEAAPLIGSDILRILDNEWKDGTLCPGM